MFGSTMKQLFLSLGAIIILKLDTVEAPNNCAWFNENQTFRDNTDTCQVHNVSKKSLSEKYFANHRIDRNLRKSNWEHDVYWRYANTWIDLFMPSVSNILKDAGLDPVDIQNISDVIWGNVLHINFTANLNLTGGKMSHISKLERQGDAYMSFSSGNLLQLNVTVRNSYLFCKFHYNFETTIFPYIWQSGDLFADVKNVTTNLLITLDTAKNMLDLERLTILDISSIQVELDNNLPVFNKMASKVINYILPFYIRKIIQVSEETVSEVIYMHLTELNELWFGF